MFTTSICPEAAHAIRAAHHYKSWGRDAAIRYCQKRGVHIHLLELALQLKEQSC